MSVLQCRPYKATATTTGSLSLGWYYDAAMNVISFTGFVASIFLLFQCAAVLDVFVCSIRCTLLVRKCNQASVVLIKTSHCDLSIHTNTFEGKQM
jgi:hypothetical protein